MGLCRGFQLVGYRGLLAGSLATLLVSAAAKAPAALLTFDEVVEGETTFAFDGDGDGTDDVIFTTTDSLGFQTIGPGPNQNFIDEPGLEGTSLLNPDLRVGFLNGASGSLTFGFALNSARADPSFFASIQIRDSANSLLGSASVPGAFTPTPFGTSAFPEGEVSVVFSGIASHATFNFTSEIGRYIIDNLEGTFGSTEEIPEPSAALLLVIVLGATARRHRLARRAP